MYTRQYLACCPGIIQADKYMHTGSMLKKQDQHILHRKALRHFCRIVKYGVHGMSGGLGLQCIIQSAFKG